MVGSVRSGSSFAGLAGYLEFGRGADDEDGRGVSAEVRRAGRVAFVETRNVEGVGDAGVAAGLMQETVESLNSRVEQAVYHLAVGLSPEDGDPKDPRTHAVLRRVAHGVLERIGLGEHEALIVGHQDTAHPHVHIMVNQVHPETGRAWERWHDYAKIEQSLRAMEVELGLRIVPGKHAPVPELRREQADIARIVGDAPAAPEAGRRRLRDIVAPARDAARERAVGRRPSELDDFDRRPALTSAERQMVRRTGDVPLVDQAQTAVADVRASRSWAELEGLLAARGLRVEAKGQGLSGR